jgi:hypothetical protein
MAKNDPTPAYILVVVQPFGDYQRGDKITDQATIDKVLAGENAHHCHKVAA